MIHLHVESKNQTIKKRKKKKEAHRYREHQSMVARGRWWGMNQLGERDQKVQISNYTINMS